MTRSGRLRRRRRRSWSRRRHRHRRRRRRWSFLSPSGGSSLSGGGAMALCPWAERGVGSLCLAGLGSGGAWTASSRRDICRRPPRRPSPEPAASASRGSSRPCPGRRRGVRGPRRGARRRRRRWTASWWWPPPSHQRGRRRTAAARCRRRGRQRESPVGRRRTTSRTKARTPARPKHRRPRPKGRRHFWGLEWKRERAGVFLLLFCHHHRHHHQKKFSQRRCRSESRGLPSEGRRRGPSWRLLGGASWRRCRGGWFVCRRFRGGSRLLSRRRWRGLCRRRPRRHRVPRRGP
mmetsp:Transcript_5/g.14  ORF Transcript_5/g.14 Transcript_5/m.14 type:complete len:291 (-) Transcript_5:444-1316(-)